MKGVKDEVERMRDEGEIHVIARSIRELGYFKKSFVRSGNLEKDEGGCMKRER